VRSLFSWPSRPATPTHAAEASIEQVVLTGAAGGAWGADPAESSSDVGWRPVGTAGRREVPWWTQEKARIYSVAAYRANPMAKAIVDTYVSFIAGDKGIQAQAMNADVQQIVDDFWTDPWNDVAGIQEIELRSLLLMGEKCLVYATGETSGVVRFKPVDPTFISDVTTVGGNPHWLDKISFAQGGAAEDPNALSVVRVDDLTGLRTGAAALWRPFRALDTDIRSQPFLASILDSLDSYDEVLSNLVDRTALARYLVWDVTVQGGQPEVEKFIRERGGTHVPRSGSVEVHNQTVQWEAKSAPSGAEEDTQAASSILTQVAGGAGLSKHWLAEPDGANRATSQSMAEPVRRRVQGTQKIWLALQAERTRFAIDRAVAAGRLPAMVDTVDPRTGEARKTRAAQALTVTGPEVAAADAQITAQVLLNISTGLQNLVDAGIMTAPAARVAARKAWEDYVGVPYVADLDKPDAAPDDVATHVDDTTQTAPPLLTAVGGRR